MLNDELVNVPVGTLLRTLPEELRKSVHLFRTDVYALLQKKKPGSKGYVETVIKYTRDVNIFKKVREGTRGRAFFPPRTPEGRDGEKKSPAETPLHPDIRVQALDPRRGLPSATRRRCTCHDSPLRLAQGWVRHLTPLDSLSTRRADPETLKHSLRVFESAQSQGAGAPMTRKPCSRLSSTSSGRAQQQEQEQERTSMWTVSNVALPTCPSSATGWTAASSCTTSPGSS